MAMPSIRRRWKRSWTNCAPSWAAGRSARGAAGSATRIRQRLHLPQNRLDAEAAVVEGQFAHDAIAIDAQGLLMLRRRLVAAGLEESQPHLVEGPLGDQRGES